MDTLQKLTSWFSAQCNGEWEHTYGIKIATLDNPGWELRIDLTETALVDQPFEAIQRDRSEKDWVRCRLEGTTFAGYGGVSNLDELINIFLDWVNQSEPV
jgi:hypothetical protein